MTANELGKGQKTRGGRTNLALTPENALRVSLFNQETHTYSTDGAREAGVTNDLAIRLSKSCTAIHDAIAAGSGGMEH